MQDEIRMPSDFQKEGEHQVRVMRVEDLPADDQERYRPLHPTRTELLEAKEKGLTPRQVAERYETTPGRVVALCKHHKIFLQRDAPESKPRPPQSVPAVKPEPLPRRDAGITEGITEEHLRQLVLAHPNWTGVEIAHHLSLSQSGWYRLLKQLKLDWLALRRACGVPSLQGTRRRADQKPPPLEIPLDLIRQALEDRANWGPRRLARYLGVSVPDLRAAPTSAGVTLAGLLREIKQQRIQERLKQGVSATEDPLLDLVERYQAALILHRQAAKAAQMASRDLEQAARDLNQAVAERKTEEKREGKLLWLPGGVLIAWLGGEVEVNEEAEQHSS